MQYLSNAADMLGLHYIPDIIKFINVNPFDLVFHFSHVYLFFNHFGLHLTIFWLSVRVHRFLP